MTEQNVVRQALYRQLMAVPHRKYGPMVAALRGALRDDPAFISRACVYVATGGSNIRDQQDSAVIALLQAPATYPEYREAGRCLLLGSDVYDIAPEGCPGLPPFRIFRIHDYMNSRVVARRNGEEVGRYMTFKEAQKGVPRIAARLNVPVGSITVEVEREHAKSPRLMRSIMADYMEALERSPDWFDSVYLHNRHAVQALYRQYRFPHGARVQAIVYENSPPADSKMGILRQIAQSDNPREQMRLVQEHKIPYRILVSVLPKITPAAGVILLEAMSPTEALNSRRWVESMGLLNIPECREAYEKKVSEVKSVASAQHRRSAQGEDEGVQRAIDAGKQQAVEKGERIGGNVLLVVDHSGSMQVSIRIAPMLAARIIPHCDGDVMLALHNDYARVENVTGYTLAQCEQSLRGVRAGGMTSHQAALDAAIRKGFEPDKIVFVTDGGENVGDFTGSLEQRGLCPQMVMLSLRGESNVLARRLLDGGYQVDVLDFDGDDYYLFDQIPALLGGPPALSLVERILETELPRRARPST